MDERTTSITIVPFDEVSGDKYSGLKKTKLDLIITVSDKIFFY